MHPKYISYRGHRYKLAYDPKEVAKGVEVEKEHSDTIEWLKEHPESSVDDAAEEIAKDHLDELPDYYTRLDRMEEEGKKK